jgi:hypothetical protein
MISDEGHEEGEAQAYKDEVERIGRREAETG